MISWLFIDSSFILCRLGHQATTSGSPIESHRGFFDAIQSLQLDDFTDFNMFQHVSTRYTFSYFLYLSFFPICFHNFSIFPIVSLSHAFSYLHKLKINHYISAEVKVETLECMRIYLHDHDSKARFLQPGSWRWGPAVWQEDEENGDSIDWEPLERILGRAWWETDGKRHETGNSVKWHETVRETVRKFHKEARNMWNGVWLRRSRSLSSSGWFDLKQVTRLHGWLQRAASRKDRVGDWRDRSGKIHDCQHALQQRSKCRLLQVPTANRQHVQCSYSVLHHAVRLCQKVGPLGHDWGWGSQPESAANPWQYPEPH